MDFDDFISPFTHELSLRLRRYIKPSLATQHFEFRQEHSAARHILTILFLRLLMSYRCD